MKFVIVSVAIWTASLLGAWPASASTEIPAACIDGEWKIGCKCSYWAGFHAGNSYFSIAVKKVNMKTGEETRMRELFSSGWDGVEFKNSIVAAKCREKMDEFLECR